MAHWHWLSLLANADLGRAFVRYSRRSGSLTENWYLVAVFVAIPLLWLALACWDRYRQRLARRAHTPKALFLELCTAHRLARLDRGLLWKTVQSRQMGQPAAIFTDPAILADLSACGTAEAEDYARLREKLFGPPVRERA